jgi:hypothetical protein
MRDLETGGIVGAGRPVWLLAAVLGAFAAGNLAAATSGAEQGANRSLLPGESVVELEQVDVIGKKLHQMRRELIAAQDRFYAHFNELNTNDDFDIHCTMHAPIGTGIRQRQCRLEFLKEAAAQEGHNFFLGLTSDPPTITRSGVPVQTQWYARSDEYRETVKALLETSPELQELALTWQRLQEQYDAARKQRLEGRRMLIE